MYIEPGTAASVYDTRSQCVPFFQTVDKFTSQSVRVSLNRTEDAYLLLTCSEVVFAAT